MKDPLIGQVSGMSAKDKAAAEPAETGDDDDGSQVEPETGMDHFTNADMSSTEDDSVWRCGDWHHESGGGSECGCQ